MADHDGRRSVWHALAELGGALKRGLLGRAAEHPMGRFAGMEQYWRQTIAAQLGWPRGANRPAAAGEADEPVFGLPGREVDDWLARNPRLRPVYEAELSRLRARP